MALFLTLVMFLAAQAGSGSAPDLPVLPRSAELAPDAGDPAREGWLVESFYGSAGGRLHDLEEILVHSDRIDAKALGLLIDPSFSCGPLAPAAWRTVFEDASVRVERPAPSGPAEPPVFEGVAGFARALSEVVAPYRAPAATGLRAAFKLYRVDIRGGRADTRVRLETSGRTPGGFVQGTAEWEIIWTVPEGEDGGAGPPRIVSVRTADHERVTARGPRGTLFSDATRSVLAGEPGFESRLMIGVDTWWGHLDNSLGMDPLGHRGLAVADVNGDGLDDVYLCQTGGFPNRLFLQNPDGTATDRAAEAGIDFLDRTRGALFVDFDGDADQDLVLALPAGLKLMENKGSARFEARVTLPVGRNFSSMAAADPDNDGDLDLFVARYYPSRWTLGMIPTPIPYHDANNGGANVYLRNDGDWTFTDRTAEAGLDVNNTRFSFAAAWEDYDNDGDVDLYVANDFGRNNLYRNEKGRFVDVAAEAGVEDLAAGMSVTWADANRDGFMDVYVSNMFSGAGNRITFQERFQKGADEETRAHFQRHARGNSLFLNNGDGTFRDVSVEANVTFGRWAWGSLFVDINNDGLEDLVVSNGYLSSDDTGDL